MEITTYSNFLKIQICVGTILSAKKNIKLKKPSIILTIDFGKNIGIKKSSAQLIANYDCIELVNKQIIAVINFSPKLIGSLISEVLVLGFPDENNQPILVVPEKKIKNGETLY